VSNLYSANLKMINATHADSSPLPSWERARVRVFFKKTAKFISSKF